MIADGNEKSIEQIKHIVTSKRMFGADSDYYELCNGVHVSKGNNLMEGTDVLTVSGSGGHSVTLTEGDYNNLDFKEFRFQNVDDVNINVYTGCDKDDSLQISLENCKKISINSEYMYHVYSDSYEDIGEIEVNIHNTTGMGSYEITLTSNYGDEETSLKLNVSTPKECKSINVKFASSEVIKTVYVLVVDGKVFYHYRSMYGTISAGTAENTDEFGSGVPMEVISNCDRISHYESNIHGDYVVRTCKVLIDGENSANLYIAIDKEK